MSPRVMTMEVHTKTMAMTKEIHMDLALMCIAIKFMLQVMIPQLVQTK